MSKQCLQAKLLVGRLALLFYPSLAEEEEISYFCAYVSCLAALGLATIRNLINWIQIDITSTY